MLEDNIAIIVGCMPAFAAFMKAYVGGSTFIKSLRTRIFGGKSKSGSLVLNENLQGPIPVPFVQDKEREAHRNHYYYELNDTIPMTQTEVVAQNPRQQNFNPQEDERGIMKTVNLSQIYHPHTLV